MNLHRLGVKFFVADSTSVRLSELIPVFHGWIQKQNLPGHLLIDVHDYSHVHNGPGILLVAHEGNFSLDMADGRSGLLYYRKIPTALELPDHIAMILKSALEASRLLEKDARIRLNMDEFMVVANDRLNAPNDAATFAELQPALASALKRVFEKEFQITRWSEDPKDRLAVRCSRL